MKVILLQNVAKIGQKGDIKEVSEGYAINYLLPRKLAKFADKSAIKETEEGKKARSQKEEALQSRVKAILAKINGQTIEIIQKANEKGHLFAQVHIKEIADAIAEKGFKEISEDWINLKNPIKEVGNHEINLEAYGAKAKIHLVIKTA